MLSRIRSHLVALPAAFLLLGSAKAPSPPGPVLEPKKQASAESGAVKLAQPLDTMVLLPGGGFTIGSGLDEWKAAKTICGGEVLGDLCREKDYPFGYEIWAHTAYLDAFFIDRTEVTVAAYRRCMTAGECSTPTFTSGDARFDRDDLPVTHVSYDDARSYCAFRGGRLPTEAEWERAARGGKPRRYPWGDLPNPKLANHGALDLGSVFLSNGEPLYGVPDTTDGFAWLAPVGSFPNGATPEGVHDLAGNVAEWVSDWFSDQYPNAAVGNPKGPPSGQLRVVRGGSYRHPMAMLRGAFRDRRPGSAREPTIGFRCVRDPKPS